MTTSVSSFILYIKTICILLWKSISSIDFYSQVYKRYRGYGVKYIATLCFFCVILYTAALLNQMSIIRDDLLRADNNYIEHILRQIPVMNYNGNSLSATSDSPLFIKDAEDHIISLIDLSGAVSFAEKAKIPLIFAKNNLTFNIASKSKDSREITIEYSNFLGKDQLEITESAVRNGLIKALAINFMSFGYIVPLLFVMYFMQIMLKLMTPVAIVYFGLSIYGLEVKVKTAIRLVMFASGVFVVMNACLMLILPQFMMFADMANVLAGSLMVISLIREKNK
jgi:hypothetical protein